jgi:low affinity Fe/Cu permease
MNSMFPFHQAGVSTPSGKRSSLFRRASTRTAKWLGSPSAFAASVAFVVIWAATGPHFGYSDTWQLIVNTVTSVVTFLMVFLIQNTQNREATALHLKLDELIRAMDGARNRLVRLEDMEDEELEKLEEEFRLVQRREERAQRREHAANGDGRSRLRGPQG